MRYTHSGRKAAIAALTVLFASSSLLSAGENRVFDEETLFYRLSHRERIIYNGLQYLLNDHQKRHYLSLETRVERDEWLRRFWLDMDPTPTTNYNERKKEHSDRVRLAVERFGCTDPPGWDDRGEILIRFGMPDSTKRVWSEVNRLEQRWPSEVWYYWSPPMLVTFTDSYLSGRYVLSSEAAGLESWTEDYYSGNFSKSSRMILEDLANMYHPNRTTEDAVSVPTFSPSGPRGYDRPVDLSKKGSSAPSALYVDRPIQDLGTMLHYSDDVLGRSSIINSFLPAYIDPDLSDSRNSRNPDAIDYMHYWEVPGNNLMSVTFRNVTDEYVKADRALYEFYRQVQTTRFIHDPGFDFDMQAYFDITSFHAGQEKLRTEINFEIPVSEITFDTSGARVEGEVELRVKVWDLDMREMTSKSEIFRISVPKSRDSMVPAYLPGQVLLTLDPGYYRFGIETIDANSGSRGVFRTNRLLACSRGLSLSDIQFARKILESDQNSRYRKGTLLVVPYPLRLYRKTFPISFYFEIYGLDTDREDFGFYDVEYTVTPTEKKRWGPIYINEETGITANFSVSGYGSQHPMRLEINTENLWSGRFLLNVRVTDRRTRKSAEQAAAFSIID